MARMRSLKPEFWADEELACNLTRDERMLYLGLWNLADEHSRLRGDPRYIKGQLFAYDDDITPDGIEKMLGSLAELDKVRPYRAKGGRYLFLPNLSKHQRLETEKVPSRLPGPGESEHETESGPDGVEPGAGSPDYRANKSARDPDEPEPDADELPLMHVAGGMEHVAGSADAAQDAPPKRKRATRIPDDFTVTPELVEWARDRCLHVDGRTETEKFVNYWRAKSGKDATKLDWVLTWKNWMITAEQQAARASPARHQPTPGDHRREWERNRA